MNSKGVGAMTGKEAQTAKLTLHNPMFIGL